MSICGFYLLDIKQRVRGRQRAIWGKDHFFVTSSASTAPVWSKLDNLCGPALALLDGHQEIESFNKLPADKLQQNES